jgi:hypothetical protein
MKLVVTIFLSIIVVSLSAQTQRCAVKISPASIIYLDNLTGAVTLINSQSDSLVATTEFTISGTIIGYSNSKKRPHYELSIQQDSTGIVITPKQRPNLVSVGISTITENISTIIAIPSYADVRIKNKNADINVKGNFELFEAHSEHGNITMQLLPIQIRKLICSTTKGEISVDGHDYKEDFSYTNTGKSIYSIVNKKGKIIVNFSEK